ncbi:MAG: Tat pathway signal protein [Burkholderiales bacterium]|nr:MAG: Tat pathway signal protein [Burkholderiales bacterium]
MTRRRFASSASVALGGFAGLGLSACSTEPDPQAYESAVAQTWRLTSEPGQDGAAPGPRPAQALSRELVRLATLAPSSHNTQCWKFALEEQAVVILPDLARRCPAVDPDEHHVFVSLGCACENLVQAGQAHGFSATARFDAAHNTIRVALEPLRTPTSPSPLFRAIAARQCTRGDYDGQPLTREELRLLEQAGTSSGVRLLLLTERPALERVLDWVVQGNTAQMADPAFIKELKTWIRFNGKDAVRTRDGLFSVASGSPQIPSWLGDMAFGWLLTSEGENEKYTRQIRSSAGIAVFVGEAADPSHWVEVGRCYERFALQATALGIRNAFVNQPVEVAAVRAPFAAAIGLAGQRPDLVVRFGRGPTLPRSLRRPVQAVLV